jgi:hypothetical protein
MKQHDSETHVIVEKSEALIVDLNLNNNGNAITEENNSVLLKKSELIPKRVKGLRI